MQPILNSSENAANAAVATTDANLYETVAMLQQVLDHLPQAVGWQDANAVFQGCNRAFATAVGLGHPADIVGKTAADVPRALAAITEPPSHDRSVNTVNASAASLAMQTGTASPLDVNQIPLHDDNGAVTGMLCIVADPLQTTVLPSVQTVTTRAFLENVIDEIPDPVFVKDSQHIWTLMNKSMCDFIGMSRETLLGKSDYDIFPKAEADVFWEKDDLVLTSGTENLNEEVLTDVSGHAHYIATKKTVFEDAVGNRFLVGIIRDITERKLMEEALRQSEARFHKLTSNLPGMLYQLVQQPDGMLTFPYVSLGCEELLGLSQEQILLDANQFIHLIAADDRDGFQASIEQSASHTSPWQWEGRFILPSGQVKWAQGTARPEPQPNGGVLWNGFLIDITPRKQAETALQEAHDDLEHRIAERTAELATINQTLRAEIAERNQVEMALRASEARLRALVDNLPFGFWASDTESRHIMQNATSIHQWGDLIGKRPQDLGLPPDVLGAWLENNDRVLTGDVLRFENRYEKDDQSWICSTILAPIRDGTKICGLLGVDIDITEQKLAEEAIRENEERLRLVLESMPVMMDAFDADGHIIMWNSECERVTGYTAAEIIGNPHALDMLYPDPAYRAQMISEWARLGNNFRNWEWEIGCKDGSRKTILWSNLSDQFPIPGWAGWGIGIDISERARLEAERKQAEATLRRSEEQLREQAYRERLLNRLTSRIRNSLDFDIILETTLREVQNFVEVDRCQFAWYHTNRAEPCLEVIKEVCYTHLPSLENTYTVAQLGSLVDRLQQFEVVKVDDATTVDDPTFQPLLQTLDCRTLLVIPMQMQSGLIGVLACCHSTEVHAWTMSEVDLLQAVMSQLAIALTQAELYTQSRSKAQALEQALRELQRTQAQMVQSEKMSSLGQLVAGIAHEINNPVNFIYGNLNHASNYTQDLLHLIALYQEHYPEPATAIQTEAEAIDLEFLLEDLPKLLASMKVGADRIQKIVLSLRNFSRMDEAEVKAVDIHDGIDSTLMILQNRLKARAGQTSIEVVKAYGELPLVECYPGQLNQVFMNILANAIDALEEFADSQCHGDTPYTPTIRIQTEPLDRQWIAIRIIDNGCGMPNDRRERLFDPFFTTKPVGKGTGLGLSISYQIVVEKHGGRLTCDSTLGQGTEFRIEIPVQRSQVMSDLTS